MNTVAPCITTSGRLPAGRTAPPLPLQPRWDSLREQAFRIQQVSLREATQARTQARIDLHNALISLGGDFRLLAQYSGLLADQAVAIRDLLAPFDPRNPDEVRE